MGNIDGVDGIRKRAGQGSVESCLWGVVGTDDMSDLWGLGSLLGNTSPNSTVGAQDVRHEVLLWYEDVLT